MAKLKGKIIRILDKRTVIINLGKENGIEKESIFSVYGKPEEIIDPETKESLGSVVLIKAKIRATQVFDKFTIASTRWSENIFSLSSAITSNMLSAKEIDQGELNILPEEMEPWKVTSGEPVRIGDVVEVTLKKPKDNSNENEKKTDDSDLNGSKGNEG